MTLNRIGRKSCWRHSIRQGEHVPLDFTVTTVMDLESREMGIRAGNPSNFVFNL